MECETPQITKHTAAKMASIGLALTNVILGFGNIGAGIGFDVADKKKMDELDEKSQKLKEAVTSASNLYDHVYYLVAVNLDRVKKALDKLPSDMLDKLQQQITSDISDSDAEKAIKTIAKVIGYTVNVAGLGSGILQIVRSVRSRRAENEEPPPANPDPFEMVPLNSENPPAVPDVESSFSRTPKLDRVINGLNIAGIVFGIAGLATTIGLGVWTLDKLDDAISEVEQKQEQVTAYQKAMEKALESVVEEAGLPAKNYSQLTTMAATWKKISENFDSYQKAMDYAIRGYFLDRSFDAIKKLVERYSDPGKSLPDDGYPLAKTLADDIRYMFGQKKTDKQIVAFFATENPKIGLRFVFDEFFISSLRWIQTLPV